MTSADPESEGVTGAAAGDNPVCWMKKFTADRGRNTTALAREHVYVGWMSPARACGSFDVALVCALHRRRAKSLAAVARVAVARLPTLTPALSRRAGEGESRVEDFGEARRSFAAL
jgi:hypothetical protein